MADDLAALLGHVDTGPAIAVGHSMGGKVGNHSMGELARSCRCNSEVGASPESGTSSASSCSARNSRC